MPNREKVTFSPNIPTQVILDGPGELQPSKNGDQEYRYFLDGQKIMWVPPEVHTQIQRHGAREGDAITITRVKAAGRTASTWEVEHEAEEPAEAAIRSAETAPASRTPLPAAIRHAEAARIAQRRPQPPQLPPPLIAADAQELAITPLHAQLFGSLAAAIDAAHDAEAYAQAHGLLVRFTAEDVRALAITAYIQTTRSGGRQ